MANKRPKPEEIVTKLRQVEVLCGQGMPRIDAIRQVQIFTQLIDMMGQYQCTREYIQMASNQSKMKIIPEKDDQMTNAHVLVLEGHDLPRDYANFLEKWGGGFIFPNTYRFGELAASRVEHPIFAIQYFFTAEKIVQERDFGKTHNCWNDDFIPIARISGGDYVLLKVTGNEAGSCWFWSSFGDGIKFYLEKIGTNFTELLEKLEFAPEMGKTPPWNRMKSVNDAPAVDLDLNALR